MTTALLPLLDASTASPDSRVLLEQIHATFGVTPNMFKALAHSPAALRSMAGSFAALSAGAIDPLLGEKIAVAVADRNACEYCLAVHTVLGRKAGATAEEMQAAQMGEDRDPKTTAVLRFALKLVDERGQVGPGDVQGLREVGCTDAQIVEVLAHVALNLFTNYVNVALRVPVDFPKASLRHAA